MPAAFAKLLHAYRKKRGLGTRELAKAAGIHFASLSKAETDARPLPPKDIAKIASTLNLTPEETANLWLAAFKRKVAGDTRLVPYLIVIEARLASYETALAMLADLAQKRGVKIPDSLVKFIHSHQDIL